MQLWCVYIYIYYISIIIIIIITYVYLQIFANMWRILGLLSTKSTPFRYVDALRFILRTRGKRDAVKR